MPAGDSVKTHPQVEWITQQILDGVSPYVICRNTDPYISAAAISNFKTFHVLPALKNAERLAAIDRARLAQSDSHLGGNALPDNLDGDGSLLGADADDLVREAFGAGVVLAARSKRLGALQAVFDDLQELKRSRAEELTDEAFGGHTGLLVRKVKTEGRVEFLYDKALVDSMLEVSRRVAEETGQWQDQGHANVQVNIVIPGGAGASAATIDVQPVGIALPVRKGG